LPSFTHGAGEIAMEISKEQERPRLAILFTHKDQRNMRREQQGSQQELTAFRPCEANQPFT
jgi:hypothetical protein